MMCRIPESVAERVSDMAWELRLSRSDLVGWSALYAPVSYTHLTLPTILLV